MLKNQVGKNYSGENMKSNDLLLNYKILKNQLLKLQKEIQDKHNLIRTATVFEFSSLAKAIEKLIKNIYNLDVKISKEFIEGDFVLRCDIVVLH